MLIFGYLSHATSHLVMCDPSLILVHLCQSSQCFFICLFVSHAKVGNLVCGQSNEEIVCVKLVVHPTCFAGETFQCYTYNFFDVLHST